MEQIAEEFGVSPLTVWKWLRWYREGGRAALANGASVPALPGNRTGRHWIDLAARLRRECRLTSAEKLALPGATVARWLRGLGLGRLNALQPPRRYQRQRPGALIHLDVRTLGRRRNGIRRDRAGRD